MSQSTNLTCLPNLEHCFRILVYLLLDSPELDSLPSSSSLLIITTEPIDLVPVRSNLDELEAPVGSADEVDASEVDGCGCASPGSLASGGELDLR